MTDEPAPPTVQPRNLVLEKASIDYRSGQTQVVLGAIAVVLLSLVVYGPLMLQQVPIADGAAVQHAVSALNGDSSPFLDDVSGRIADAAFGYRPFYYLFVLGEAFLFRDGASGYRCVNLVLLIASCLLTSFTVFEITGRFGNRLGACPAIWAGLLLAVYPLNSVLLSTISGTQALLGMTLGLAALFSFLRFRGTEQRVYFGISIASALLGLFAWESALLLPLILTMTYILPDGSLTLRVGRLRQFGRRIAPFWFMLAVYAVAFHDRLAVLFGQLGQTQPMGTLINLLSYGTEEVGLGLPTYAFLALCAFLLLRPALARTSWRGALFVIAWVFLYLFAPHETWAAASIPPLCAALSICLLPAIDPISKSMSVFYATAGSQLLVILFCYWALRMLS